MNSIKLIISDIDGTFLTNDKKVSDINLKALKELKKRGIKFGLASGRALGTLQEMMRRANALDYVDYYLYYNGYGIYDVANDCDVHTFEMLPDWNKEILERYQDLDLVLIDYDGYSIISSGINEIVENLIHFSGFTPKIVSLDYFKEHAFAKFMITGTKETLDVLWQRYNSEAQDERYVGYRTSDGVYDFMNRKVSKRNSLMKLKDDLKLDLEEVLVFGDAENDYEMLVSFPNSVAVANAQEAIKKVVKYHTLSNEESGVGQFILDHVIG